MSDNSEQVRWSGRVAIEYMTMALRYTHAIVCRIPDSFQTNAVGTTGTIDLSLAKEQHAAYTNTLRRLGLDVIELPADEALPDCVFVEDTSIVANGTAFITRPGHASRQNEVFLFISTNSIIPFS